MSEQEKSALHPPVAGEESPNAQEAPTPSALQSVSPPQDQEAPPPENIPETGQIATTTARKRRAPRGGDKPKVLSGVQIEDQSYIEEFLKKKAERKARISSQTESPPPAPSAVNGAVVFHAVATKNYVEQAGAEVAPPAQTPAPVQEETAAAHSAATYADATVDAAPAHYAAPADEATLEEPAYGAPPPAYQAFVEAAELAGQTLHQQASPQQLDSQPLVEPPADEAPAYAPPPPPPPPPAAPGAAAAYSQPGLVEQERPSSQEDSGVLSEPHAGPPPPPPPPPPAMSPEEPQAQESPHLSEEPQVYAAEEQASAPPVVEFAQIRLQASQERAAPAGHENGAAYEAAARSDEAYAPVEEAGLQKAEEPYAPHMQAGLAEESDQTTGQAERLEEQAESYEAEAPSAAFISPGPEEERARQPEFFTSEAPAALAPESPLAPEPAPEGPFAETGPGPMPGLASVEVVDAVLAEAFSGAPPVASAVEEPAAPQQEAFEAPPEEFAQYGSGAVTQAADVPEGAPQPAEISPYEQADAVAAPYEEQMAAGQTGADSEQALAPEPAFAYAAGTDEEASVLHAAPADPAPESSEGVERSVAPAPLEQASESNEPDLGPAEPAGPSAAYEPGSGESSQEDSTGRQPEAVDPASLQAAPEEPQTQPMEEAGGALSEFSEEAPSHAPAPDAAPQENGRQRIRIPWDDSAVQELEYGESGECQAPPPASEAEGERRSIGARLDENAKGGKTLGPEREHSAPVRNGGNMYGSMNGGRVPPGAGGSGAWLWLPQGVEERKPWRKRHPILFWGIVLLLGALVFNAGRVSMMDIPLGGTRLAVVNLEGVILDSESVVKWIERIGKDDTIKGVLLRVNSPGGAVGPSQEIYAALKRLDAKKPVVASLGTLAASGGYYAALAAREIIAGPSTITGSIGIKMQVPNVEGLMRTLGVSERTLVSGAYKDAGSVWRQMSREEEEYFYGIMDDMYEEFVGVVAHERKISMADMANIADGKAVTGRQAMLLKLVDGLGDKQDALSRLKVLCKIDENAQVALVEGPKGKSNAVKDFLLSLLSMLQEQQSVGVQPMFIY